MIKRSLTIATICALAGALSACTVTPYGGISLALPSTPAATVTQSVNPPIVDVTPAPVSSYLSDQDIANMTSQRFGADEQTGGMVGVIDDIQACYPKATDRSEMKQCVALDMAGEDADSNYSHQTHEPGLDFFALQAWEDRMTEYDRYSFGTARQTLAFMKNYIVPHIYF